MGPHRHGGHGGHGGQGGHGGHGGRGGHGHVPVGAHARAWMGPPHHRPHHHAPPHHGPGLWCFHRRGPPPPWMWCCTFLGITACCCPPAAPLHGSVADVDAAGNPVVVPEAQVMGEEGEGDALIRRGPRTLKCNEYEEGAPSKRYRLEIPSDAFAGEVLQVELDQRPFSVTVPESFTPGEGVVVVAPAP